LKTTLNTLAACALLACASAAFAGGNHAGGHDHVPAKAAIIGETGVAANVSRTVEVDMSDAMRFTPAAIEAKQGETIRFVVKNSGQFKHEFVLGTDKDLKAHYEVMKKNPHMVHADDNMLTVAPGQNAELLWKFTQAGTVNFACLQPGHYDAGMKGAVVVDANGVEMSDGEVKKIDKAAQKITLKHGELKNLDMPGMTMVFSVKDAALLDKVKAGDKVKFTAEEQGGALVVTAIELLK